MLLKFDCNFLAAIAAAFLTLGVFAAPYNDEIVFWTPARESAKAWEAERLPLGNGSLGAMPTGGIMREEVQFNVDSLWTGGENLSGASETLSSAATDKTVGDYQNFGVLAVEFDYTPTNVISSYKRVLDLKTAVQTVTFTGVKREMFVSAPANVLAMRFTADKDFGCKVTLSGTHDEVTRMTGEGSLVFSGKLPNDLAYTARADVYISQEKPEVVVYLRAKTSYDLKRADFGLGQPCEPYAEPFHADFDELMREHIADYSRFYDRVHLEIEGDAKTQEIVRLFNFGRYLLISSSRPGTLPANLQGIWCQTNSPAWHSDYHTNINLQMNYWAVDTANLPEMFEPVASWLPAANRTAWKETMLAFPGAKGVAYRTSLNAFGGGGWRWNIAGAPWMATIMYDHYLFIRDEEYLRNIAWPAMKQAADFLFGHFIKDEDGKFLVRNGWSPEHGPVAHGVAHDQQIVAELLTDIVEASAILGEKEYGSSAAYVLANLGRDKIGRWGQLQEWREDIDVQGDDHRHTSHLFAVYPGTTITRAATPALARAAAVSLAGRATTRDSRRSWTWPWRAALWARLGDGDKALAMLEQMLKYNILPNRLATHPPFQIDGNFGIVAAVCEMLVQSHERDENGNIVVRRLPAIPKAWRHGRIRGLRTRDGGTIDYEW